MNYSHRIFLYGPVGLFAALLLSIMGYWWVASDAFSKHLDAMNDHDVAPGIHFSFAKKTMAGFPFRLDTELDGLRVEIATSHGPTVWTAEHFASHALTYGPTHLIFEAAGQQHVEWHDDAGQLHIYDFLPGALRASLLLDHTGLLRFDLDLLDDDATDISAARVQLHLRRDPKFDGLDLFFSADGVHMAPELKPAFGPDLKHLALDAMISPGSSFDGVLAGHADWRATAEDWHKHDGGILVKNIEIDWGKLDATGKGALAVDDLHRPLGALHLKLTGWQDLLRQLSQREIQKSSYNGLAAGFSTFAAGADTRTDQLDTVIAFKNGVVFVGSVPSDLLSPLY